MDNSSSFTSTRVTRTRVQHYAAAPDALFPLHGPAGETRWAVGWEPEIIYAGGPAGEQGAIFVTHHGGADAVWVNTCWNPGAGRIAYVHVSECRDVTEIDIRITPAGPASSRVEVTYTWTGLTPEGNAFVEAQDEERFGRMMDEWEEEMAHYLRTGTKLRRARA